MKRSHSGFALQMVRKKHSLEESYLIGIRTLNADSDLIHFFAHNTEVMAKGFNELRELIQAPNAQRQIISEMAILMMSVFNSYKDFKTVFDLEQTYSQSTRNFTEIAIEHEYVDLCLRILEYPDGPSEHMKWLIDIGNYPLALKLLPLLKKIDTSNLSLLFDVLIEKLDKLVKDPDIHPGSDFISFISHCRSLMMKIYSRLSVEVQEDYRTKFPKLSLPILSKPTEETESEDDMSALCDLLATMMSRQQTDEFRSKILEAIEQYNKKYNQQNKSQSLDVDMQPNFLEPSQKMRKK